MLKLPTRWCTALVSRPNSISMDLSACKKSDVVHFVLLGLSMIYPITQKVYPKTQKFYHPLRIHKTFDKHISLGYIVMYAGIRRNASVENEGSKRRSEVCHIALCIDVAIKLDETRKLTFSKCSSAIAIGL